MLWKFSVQIGREIEARMIGFAIDTENKKCHKLDNELQRQRKMQIKFISVIMHWNYYYSLGPTKNIRVGLVDGK